MKVSSGQAFICHGFNNHFEPPKFVGERRVMFRTAVVIKKCDFYDVWDVYDDLFWRMVIAIAAEIADSYRIKVIDQTAPAFNSLSELRTWQSYQKKSDSEFVLDPPGEIDFFSADAPICHMELEDWSDVGKVEPYSCSYTFSFYSHDVKVNAKIGNVLQKFLSSDTAISAVSEVVELPRPKWYWPILNVIKSDTFFIYAGFAVMALCAVVMVLTSSTSKHNENVTWRKDVSPIAKRIPALSSCTNMLWHGEITTKDSFMSPSGPSAYRVCCFIPDPSRVLLSLLDKELSTDTSCEGDTFQPVEKAMLKSEFGIDLDIEAGIMNERLNHELLQSPYWGQCIFFRTKDILCVILCGER